MASNRTKRLLRDAFVVRLPSGLQMDLDLWEWSQEQIRRTGAIEPLTTAWLRTSLRPGGVYVDVGAHVGFLTLVARQALGPAGTVIAIEPQPYNAARLLRNWQLNGFDNLLLYPCAAGERMEFVELHDQPGTDRSRLSLSGPSVPGDMPQRFCVPTVRLEDVLARHRIRRVDVLKIDVEGWEHQVLNGLGDAIGKVEKIILEVTDAGAADTQAIAALLHRHGFKLNTVRGEPWRAPDAIPESNLLATR